MTQDQIKALIHYTVQHLLGTAVIWLIGSLVALLLITYFTPHDDTETSDTRSGMTPHVDTLTGCQYLSMPNGGITPRLDASGHQICKATP